MRHSSLRRRLLAFIIDTFLVTSISTVAIIVGMSVAYPNGGEPGYTILFILLPFVVLWIYFLLGYSLFQTTIGKKLLHIKLVHKSGGKLNPAMVLLREILKVFSFPILNGLLSAWHNKERRTWYDRAAGSIVVRTDNNSDTLNLKDPKAFVKNNKILSLIILLIVIFIGSAIFIGKDSKDRPESPQEPTFKSKLEKEEQAYTISNLDHQLTETEYSAAYQESVKNVMAHMESVGKIAGNQEKVTSILLSKESQEVDPLISDIAEIQEEYKKMSMIKVPAKFEALNTDYVSALKDYADGTALFVEMFDDQDNADKIGAKAATLIQSGTDKLNAMGKKYGN